MRDNEDRVPSRDSTRESYGQSSSDVIQIFLQTQYQESQVFTCPQSLTIAQLKACLNQGFLAEPKDGISNCQGAAARFTVTFKGKELCKEWQTLRCAGVQANETLTIRVPLVGGSHVSGFFGADDKQPDIKRKSSQFFTGISSTNEFYNFMNQDEVTGEKRARFQRLLGKTSFAMGMREDIQDKFERIFTKTQIEEIMKIDDDKGYDINDKQDVYKALNFLYPQERIELLTQFKKLDNKLSEQTIRTLVKEKSVFESVKESVFMSKIGGGNEDIWSKSHVFSEAADKEFVNKLIHYDLLPKLAQGNRLYPIVSCLNIKQILEILSWDVTDLPYVSDFLTALTRTGKMVDDWALLKKMWPKLSIDERYIELQHIYDIYDKPVVQNNYAKALIQREMKKIEHSQEPSQAVKIGINNIWDCLESEQRKEQVVCLRLDYSVKVGRKPKLVVHNEEETPRLGGAMDLKQQVKLLLTLNMDNRVDFFSYVDLNQKKDLLNEIETGESGTSHKRQIFESELLHHQFFHLKEGLEVKQVQQRQGSSLEQLETNLKKVQEDMQKTWKYIPFDMPGDYLQSIPVPESNDEFICIQPNSRKDLELQSNEVIGKVINKDAWSSDETQTNEEERKKNENMRKLTVDAIGTDKQIMILENQFSIISFWKYQGKDHRTFDCQSSFATPTIIPFKDGSRKKHKRQYLFEGRNKQIFFFQVETDEENREKKLYLCLIKKKMEQQQKLDINLVNRKTDNMLERFPIDKDSALYSLMIPTPEQEELFKQDQKFHHTAPVLIDCGINAGKFIVFSLFKEKDPGPSLYFHSIKQNKVVSTIKGGEVFIDFVTHEDDERSADGHLYFMTDAYFQKTEWSSLDKKKYRNLMKIQENTQQILMIDFSLSHPVKYPIKKQDKEVQKSFVMNKKGKNRYGGSTATQILKLPEHTDYLTDDFYMKFSRAGHNIISIHPIKRDNQVDLLVHHIAIITFDFISRNYGVIILGLSPESYKCKLLTSFENPSMSSAFIQHCQDKIVLQTVIKGEEDLQLQFAVLNQKTDKESEEINYQLETSQRMQIPTGSRYYAQPMIFINEDEIFGCFLDKTEYAVHWYHEKLSNNKLGKNYQTETIMPEYIIDYPLMCFDGPFPDSRELTVVNLADISAARSILQLQNMKLIRFVGHRFWSDKTKICFLAIDYSQYKDTNKNQIVHVILSADKMFQKKLDFDMSYFSVEVEPLGLASENNLFHKYLPNIVKMESVHDLNQAVSSDKNRNQCFVIQYEFGVYLYTHYGDQAETYEVSKKGHMRKIRIKRGYNNTFYFVESDALNNTDNIIELEINVSGDTFRYNRRIAYELNSGTVIALEIDPDNDEKTDSGLMSDNKFGQRHIDNELFFIDDALVLTELKQRQNQSQSYQIIEKQNLNDIPRLAQNLRNLKNKPFPKISVTEKCIVYQGMTVNLDSSLEWTQNFNFFVQQNDSEQWQWKVNYASNIDSTHRQVLVSRRTCKQRDMVEAAFITKPLPSSRKVCLVGMKGTKFIEYFQFISNELILLKFQGNYWCILDTRGQIRPIPRNLLMQLNQATFKKMTAQRIYEKGKILILLESELLTLTILFDHNGSVCETHEYKMESRQLPSLPKENITFDRVFADAEGKVYRILDVEVEGQSPIGNKEVSVRFIKVKQEVKSQDKDESHLNLIIFNHTIKEKSSSRKFLICGDYLCWHNPEQNNCDQKSSIESQTEPSQKKIEKIDDELPHHSDIYVKPLKELMNCQNQSQTLQMDQADDRISIKPYLRDLETRNMSISVPKISTHLSQRNSQILDQSIRTSLNMNLLQVTIEDRAIIYDLENRNQAIKDFSNMQQLIGQDNFVDSEVNMQNCYSDDKRSATKVLRITREAVSNHSKEFFFAGKTYRLVDKELPNGASKSLEAYMLPSKMDGLYKTYSESDFQELMRILEDLENRKHIASFDTSAVLSTYLGQSIFSMEEQMNLYSLIEKHLRETEFQSDLDNREQEIQPHQLRRLFQVLMTPQNKLKDKKANQNQFQNTAGDIDELKTKSKEIGMFSCLEMIPYSVIPGTCNKLLAIASLCEQSSLINYADSQIDTKHLFEQNSTSVERILQKTFIESEATKNITGIKWPEGQDYAAFRHHSCLISQRQCEEQIEKRHNSKQSIYDCLKRQIKHKDSWQTHTVKVRMLDMAWLYADKKVFLDFIDILVNVQDKSILMTDFVKALLDVYWDEHKMQIFWRIFCFYLLYLGVTLYYMVNVICADENHRNSWRTYIGFVNIGLSLYMLFYVEFIQAQHEINKKQTSCEAILSYFTLMNIIDLMQHLCNVFLVICTMLHYDDFPSIETRRLMCSFLVLVVWAKMFYWFQMFDRTSFYIRLITKTVEEIINFFIIFIIFLFTFGSAMYILSTNRDILKEDKLIIADHLGNWIADIMINQYLLSLGEFDNLDQQVFEGKNTELVWVFFGLATFFTQVLALNMLIAIMSNTFDKVFDSKDLHERISKIALLSDYVGHCKQKSLWEYLILKIRQPKENAKVKNFIFVVTPTDRETQQETEWEGGINMIRKSLKTLEEDITTDFNQNIDSVKSLILDQKARSTYEDKQTRKVISDVQKNLSSVKETLNQLMGKIDHTLNQSEMSTRVANQVINNSQRSYNAQ